MSKSDKTSMSEAGVSDTDIENMKTVIMQDRKPDKTDSREPLTQLIGPPRRRGPEAPLKARDFLDNPVVGWVVVVDGPGKGTSAALSYGQNRMGRDPDQQVILNYGDDLISRSQHAIITYDPKSRRFFLQHGGGRNLTYLGNEPVLTPTTLEGGEIITLGKTKLQFVRFCGLDFDWQT